MFCENSVMCGQNRSKITLRRCVGWFALLSMLLMSFLLYVGLELSRAGDGPILIVEVKLTEFTIEMPPTVPIGPMSFSVTNAGTIEHNFEVEGQGREEKFDINLKPGETRNLRVDLPAGTSIVYCSLDDHKERGLHLELKVAQQRSQ